jgi:hypothetical protein
VYISIYLPPTFFKGKNFILGQKSRPHKDLSMIFSTLKNRPHRGACAEISEKPRRNPLHRLELRRNEKFVRFSDFARKTEEIGKMGVEN